MDDRRPAATGPDRFLWGIVVGASLLVALGVGAVFVSARALAPAPVDPASPVGVVQSYVEALRSGDVDRAYALLSGAARGSMSLDEYRRRFAYIVGPTGGEPRILLEPIRVGAERAEVRVTVSRFTASREPFSTSTYHQDVTVHLVREDGAWRISQPIGPYPFAY